MRNLILSLCLFLLAGSLSAQLTLSFTNPSAPCGTTTCVDATVENFDDVLSMQFEIQWDPSIMTYASHTDFLPANTATYLTDPANVDNGGIPFSFFLASGHTTTDPIFTICFDLIGNPGNAAVDFGAQAGSTIQFSQLVNGFFTILAPGEYELNSGMVTITDPGNASPPTISCPADMPILGTAQTVSNIAPTFTYDGCGTPVITYTLSGATTANGNDDASGELFNVGTTLVTYTISDGTNSDDCSFNVTIDDTVNPNILNLSFTDETADCGSTVCLDVEVENFEDISGMQFEIQWDPTKLDYDNLINNLPETSTFFMADIANGKIPMLFSLQVPGGLTTTNSIFTICFEVIGSPGPTSVDFGAQSGSTIEITQFTAPNFYIPLAPSEYSLNSGTVTLTNNGSQPPSISCLANMTIMGTAQAVNNIAPTSFAADCGTPNVTYALSGATTGSGNNDASGQTFNVGTTTVTYTADDGNSTGSCSFDITIDDSNVSSGLLEFTPVLNVNCQTNEVTLDIEVINFDSIKSMQWMIQWDPTVLDYNNVPETPVPNIGGSSPGIFFLDDGRLPWFWVAAAADTDGVTVADNTSILTLTYELIGTLTPPVIEIVDPAPPNLLIIVNGFDGALDPSEYVFNPVVINTVGDNVDPSFDTCPSDINLVANANSCDAVATWTEPTVSDNCDDSPVVANTSGFNSGDTFPIGTTTITYTATDDSGNTADCTFMVTVTDDASPVFDNCPSNQMLVASEVNCLATLNESISATDCSNIVYSCTLSGALTGTFDHNDLNTIEFPIGTTTVTCVASDGINVDATCSFTVEVTSAGGLDASSCPNDIMLMGMAQVVNNIAPSITASNCSSPVVTYVLSGATTGNGNNDASGETFNVGITTVTYTATDGNDVSSCSFDITIDDGTASTLLEFTPVLSVNCVTNEVTLDIEVLNFDSIKSMQWMITWDPLVLDYTNVPETPIPNIGGSSPGIFFLDDGRLPWFWVADAADTDGVTVADNTSILTITFDLIGTLADPAIEIVDPAPPNLLIIVNDFDGTMDPSEYVFNPVEINTVGDVLDPVFDTCPSNIDLVADANSCDAVATWTEPTVSDNCDDNPTVTNTSAFNSGDAFPIGTTTITYTATDASGNSSACSFDVTVTDASSPVISCPSAGPLSADANCTAVLTNVDLTVTDCSSVDISYQLSGATSSGQIVGTASGAVLNIGITTVTYTASDGINPEVTCSFDVTVTDGAGLSFDTCPSDLSIAGSGANCSGQINETISATSCLPITYVCELTGATTGASDNDLNAVVFNLGVTTVTCTASDGVNPDVVCIFDVTVTDASSPVISCPSAGPLSADANCTAVLTNVDLTVTDCSSVDISYQLSGATSSGQIVGTASGALLNIGITTVTYTASDGINPDVTCSFDVTVTDASSPVISCPSAGPLSADANCTAVLTNVDLTVTDCSSVDISYQLSGATSSGQIVGTASGALLNIGITTVTYTASDGINPDVTCSFDVTVTGDAGLNFDTCPSDLSIVGNGANCSGQINETISATSCLPITYVCELTGATTGASDNDLNAVVFNLGVTTVTCTASDGVNPDATCIFTVTVTGGSINDVMCPVSSGNVILTDEANCCAVVNDIDLFIASCSPISYSYEITGATSGNGVGDASGTCFTEGSNTVTYNYIDDISLETGSCSFSFFVEDQTDPQANCPENVTQSADDGKCSSQVFDIGPVYSDNCGDVASVVCNCIGATTLVDVPNDISGEFFFVGETTCTYVVTDLQGNTADCSFTVTITDDMLPTISCPSNVTQGTDMGSCTATVNNIAPIDPTDNCLFVVSYEITYPNPPGGTITGLGDASGEIFPIGTSTVVYTITDASDNVDMCSFTVTVFDNGDPNLDCPGDVSVNTDTGLCSAVVNNIDPLNEGDMCGTSSVTYQLTDPSANVTTGSGSLSGQSFALGTSTVMYISTDENDNTSVCTFTVTVTDNELPTVSCPDDITITLPQTVPDIFPINPNDNCGVASVCWALTGATTDTGCSFPIGTNFNEGTTQIIITITDVNGLTNVCNFNVTINNVEPPTIECPDDVDVSTDLGACSAEVFDLGVNITSDMNDVASITYVCTGAIEIVDTLNVSGEAFNVGTTTCTYIVTNTNGATATCSFDVTVSDDEAPALNCGSLDAFSADDGECSAFVGQNFIDLFAPTFSDNCTNPSSLAASLTYVISGAIEATGSGNPPPMDFPVGQSIITYTIMDLLGNESTCQVTIVVVDNQPATITCPEDVEIILDFGETSALVTNIDPTNISDNCGVQDTCWYLTGATVSGSVGSPNCYLPIDIPFNAGLTTVHYVVTDIATEGGNTVECSFNVNLTSGEPCEIECPVDVVMQNDLNECGAIVNNIPVTIVSLNCNVISTTWELTGATVATGAGDLSGQFFNVGTTTCTYMVTNDVGGVAACSFDVTVNDTQTPQIFCPSNVTVTVDEGETCIVVNDIGPQATDNCPFTVTYTLGGATTGSGIDDASGTCFNIGTTNVTYVIEDASGNISGCAFTVIVSDGNDCMIACPGAVVVDNETDMCSAVVNNLDLTLTDCTDNPTITYDLTGALTDSGTGMVTGMTFPVGETTVIYTHIESGQTCSFTVTVNDTQIPLITCPNDTIVALADGAACMFVNDLAPITSDNCDFDLSYTLSGETNGSGFGAVSGTVCFEPGTTTVIYTINDGTNSVDCPFTVTVMVNEPIIDCPSDTIVYSSTELCEVTVNDLDLSYSGTGTVSYICTGATALSGNGNASGNTFDLGITNCTYYVMDNGTLDSCEFNVTVLDTIAPVWFNCPVAPILVYTDSFSCETTATWENLAAFDNCQITSLDFDYLSGDAFPVDTTNVVYIAADAAGNADTCSFNVIVLDTIAPVIDCPIDITVLIVTAGECDAVATWDQPSATDACGVESISCDFVSGSVFPVGITTVTCTAIDSSGNISECTFDVTIVDNEVPTITCPDEIIVGLDGSIISSGGVVVSTQTNSTCDSVFINYLEPMGLDACEFDTTTVSGVPPGYMFPLGITTVTYTAIDASGNEADCSFDITVEPTFGAVNLDVPANICSGDDVTICVINPVIGASYTFTGTGAVLDPNGFCATISDISTSGNYSVLCELAQGCSSVGAVDLVVNESPAISADALIPNCSDGTESLDLSATVISGDIDSWSWTGPVFTSGDQNPSIENVNADNSGTYTVTATTAEGCSDSEPILVEIFDQPQTPSINTECKDIICLGQTCFLLGTNYVPTPEAYHWEGDGVEDSGLSSSKFTPTTAGNYLISYWVTIDGCDSEVATIGITVVGVPEANTDEYTVVADTPYNNNVIDNDIVNSGAGFNINFVQNVTNGSLVNNNDGTFDYTPDQGFVGIDTFVYQICHACSNECALATVFLNVGTEDVDCDIIQNYISPNGDGINDKLIINCLEFGDFPNSEMLITNEWGDEVYRQAPYGNGVYWDGTFKDSGDPLPDGTYYYFLTLETSGELKKGFVTLFR